MQLPEVCGNATAPVVWLLAVEALRVAVVPVDVHMRSDSIVAGSKYTFW